MVNATLIAIQDPAEAEPIPPTFCFDRRRSERQPVSGRVSLRRLDHDPDAYRFRLCSIQLHDISAGGLCAVSDVPFEKFELVCVHFPPHGHEPGFELIGHVVRCTPAHRPDEPNGYEVGICFDTRAAA